MSQFVPFQGRGRRLQTVETPGGSQEERDGDEPETVPEGPPSLQPVEILDVEEASQDWGPSMKDIEEGLRAKLEVAASWLEEVCMGHALQAPP